MYLLMNKLPWTVRELYCWVWVPECVPWSHEAPQLFSKEWMSCLFSWFLICLLSLLDLWWWILHLFFNISTSYMWSNEIWGFGLVHLFYSNLIWLNSVELLWFYIRSCEKRIGPTDGFAAATITFCLYLIFLSFILPLCFLSLFVCIVYSGKLRRKKKKFVTGFSTGTSDCTRDLISSFPSFFFF